MNRRQSLPPKRGRLIFLIFLLLFFATTLWMVIRLPAQAAPNEMLHFEYIQLLRQTRALPQAGLANTEDRLTELHQPPLYYGFAALIGIFEPVPSAATRPPVPLEWPENPAFLGTHIGNLTPVVHVTPQNTPILYTSRMATLFISILGLAAFYRAGAQLYSPATGLLMMSLLAFQPNYLHLSGSVNNDAPLTAVSAIVLSYTLLIIANDKNPRWYFGLGLLCALAVLTKASGLFLTVYIAAVCIILYFQHRDLRRAIFSGLYALAGLVPFWFGWLAINAARQMDALGVANSLPIDRLLALNPGDFLLLVPWMDDIWRSFLLDWSAGGVGYARDWFYIFWGALLIIAFLGWLRPPQHGSQRHLVAIVLPGIATILLLYFAVKALTVKEAGYLVPEGRWWLPAMPGIAWLAAVGFARWWPEAWREKTVQFTAFIPAISTLLLLLFFLPALYPQARLLPPAANIEQNVGLTYGQEIKLVRAEIEPLTNNHPAALNLSWEAIVDINHDYLVTVKLLIPNPNGWEKLDEQYTYPGYGANPTKSWREGDQYADSLILIPQGQLNGPTESVIEVQLQLDGQNMLAWRDETIVEPPFVLTTVVRPENPLLPVDRLPEPVVFGGQFSLIGVEIYERDQELDVTLWWRAEQSAMEDYAIFVHLLDGNNHFFAQADGQPNDGQSPTGIWSKGDIIRDVRHLPLPPEGNGSFLIGAYGLKDGARLPAIQGDQPLIDDGFPISVP